MLGVSTARTPSPNARVLGGVEVEWRGAEGECVPDPVTPGVLWVGGPRGGTRVQGLTHTAAGPANGGERRRAAQNMGLRDTSLQEIEARPARALSNAQLTPRVCSGVWRGSGWCTPPPLR